jgi:hypothetical protein
MEKTSADFDTIMGPRGEIVSSLDSTLEEELSTSHKFFSKQTLFNYFPRYKLKRSGREREKKREKRTIHFKTSKCILLHT